MKLMDKVHFIHSFYLNEWRRQSKAEISLFLINQLIDSFILPSVILFFLLTSKDIDRGVWLNLILFPLYFYFGGQYTTKRNIQQNAISKTLSLYGFSSREITILMDLTTNLLFYFSRILVFMLLSGYFLFKNHSFWMILTILIALSIVAVYLRQYATKMPSNLLLIGNYIFDYQTVSIFLLIVKYIDYQRSSLLVGIILIFILILYVLMKAISRKLKGKSFIREWKIALNEAGGQLGSQLFINSLFPCITLYVLYIFANNAQLMSEPKVMLIMLKIIICFIGLTSMYPIALYAFDLEKMRMFHLKNMGNFIQKKIKSKLMIAYSIHILIYFCYMFFYFLLIPDSIRVKSIVLIVSFIPICMIIPMVYFTLTILFPIFQRQYIIGYSQPSRFVILGGWIANATLMLLSIFWSVSIISGKNVMLASTVVLFVYLIISGIFIFILIRIYYQYEQFLIKGKEQIEDEKFNV